MSSGRQRMIRREVAPPRRPQAVLGPVQSSRRDKRRMYYPGAGEQDRAPAVGFRELGGPRVRYGSSWIGCPLIAVDIGENQEQERESKFRQRSDAAAPVARKAGHRINREEENLPESIASEPNVESRHESLISRTGGRSAGRSGRVFKLFLFALSFLPLAHRLALPSARVHEQAQGKRSREYSQPRLHPASQGRRALSLPVIPNTKPPLSNNDALHGPERHRAARQPPAQEARRLCR